MIGSTVRSGAPVNSVEVLPTGFDQTAGDAQFMAHSKIKVLVVEDETLVRLGIAGHLEDDGFTVLEAANANEAIAVLATDPEVSIVFTDVDMPGGMDGLKLAAVIRDRWPPIKIVVTSGHRQVGATDLPIESRFFPKPYDFERIASAFRDIAGPTGKLSGGPKNQ